MSTDSKGWGYTKDQMDTITVYCIEIKRKIRIRISKIKMASMNADDMATKKKCMAMIKELKNVIKIIDGEEIDETI